jgi:O-antigen/teichoic acid export membrane protein
VSSVRQDVKGLGASSLTYLLPTILARGLSFLLTPVYAATMGADDLGIVSITGSIWVVVTTVFSFSVHSSASRLHFDFEGVVERRRLYSTILIFLAVVPAVLAALIHVLGSFGLLDVFVTVRFHPHLRLVLWTAYFGVFPNLLINILIAQERPRATSAFSVMSVSVTVVLMLIFVVYLRQGAIGQLRAALSAGAIVAVTAVVSVLRISGLSFSVAYLKRALHYGVPLVPHALSNWALAASDRVILERFVSKAELGRYALGFTFAAIVSVTANAISMAFMSVVTRNLKAGDPRNLVPRLGTYVLAPTVLVALMVALLSGDVIGIVLPPEYQRSGSVVPAIALGFVFQAIYGLCSQGTFFSKQTRLVPVVTGLGALASVALNIWLIPRFGIMAAALNAPVAYGLLALLHGVLAHRLYPIRWEYRRWALLLAAAAVTYLAVDFLIASSPVVNLILKPMVACLLFGLSLFLMRFLRPGELTSVLGLLRRRTV